MLSPCVCVLGILRTLVGVEDVNLREARKVSRVNVEERFRRHGGGLVVELRDLVEEEAEVALLRGVEGVEGVGVRLLDPPRRTDAAVRVLMEASMDR